VTQLHPVALMVNGVSYTREVEARLLLSDFLRHELGLTGTHVGCEHGVCGACTILFDGQSMRSCLIFAVQAGKRSFDHDR
jgi:aerobic carbon-monoxide dehydrogenase small subunit